MRKFIVALLVVMLAFQGMVFASSSDVTVVDKTAAVEMLLYGSTQTGALTERIGRIEKDLHGTTTQDAVITRIDRVYQYMTDNGLAPSFISKLNSVEWQLTHNVTYDPVRTRIENLERMMNGSNPGGPLDDQLARLVKLAYGSGSQLNVVGTQITKDTLIKIVTVTPLDTRNNRVGDVVIFQAADDVYVGDFLAIAKGAQGSGKVMKIEPKRNFGRDAELVISFDSITAMDGVAIPTLMGEKAKEETKSIATAAGASIAGIALLGPIGVVGGAFVHGHDITIPAGTTMFIQVKNDYGFYALKLK